MSYIESERSEDEMKHDESCMSACDVLLIKGPVAQLVRASPCHGEGRGFESLLGRLQFLLQVYNMGS